MPKEEKMEWKTCPVCDTVNYGSRLHCEKCGSSLASVSIVKQQFASEKKILMAEKNNCRICNKYTDVKSYSFFYGTGVDANKSGYTDDVIIVPFSRTILILGSHSEYICRDCLARKSKRANMGCLGFILVLLLIGSVIAYFMFDNDNIFGGLVTISILISIIITYWIRAEQPYGHILEEQTIGEQMAWEINKDRILGAHPGAEVINTHIYFSAVGLSEYNLTYRQSIIEALKEPNKSNVGLLMGICAEALSAENHSVAFITKIIKALGKSCDEEAIEFLHTIATGRRGPDFSKQANARMKSLERRALVHGIFNEPVASSLAPLDQAKPIFEEEKARMLANLVKRLASETLAEIGKPVRTGT